mgnify:CR=1 FL=1
MEHTFSPTVYYSTIGSHPPELRVASGDTVVTTTIDAGGWDADGVDGGTAGQPANGADLRRGR